MVMPRVTVTSPIRTAALHPLSRILFIILYTLCISRCGETETESLWSKTPLSIDGDITDWNGGLLYVEDKHCSIGIMNDSTMLYLCLTTGDRATQVKINGGGLTLWLDSQGSSEKTWGLHYPVGMASLRGEMPNLSPTQRQNESQSEPNGRVFRESRHQMYETLELLGPAPNQTLRTTTYLAATQQQVRVAVRDTLEVLTIEWAIPLKRMNPNASVAPTSVSLTLQSGEMKMPDGGNMPPGGVMRGGGMPTGGMGGGGMRGGVMRGGRMPPGGGGGMQELRQPLQFAARIKLATAK
jgi:hypothetical protein